jgi:hypothetical protein
MLRRFLRHRKKCCDMFPEGNAAHLYSNSSLKHFFKNLNLLGKMWQLAADNPAE